MSKWWSNQRRHPAYDFDLQYEVVSRQGQMNLFCRNTTGAGKTCAWHATGLVTDFVYHFLREHAEDQPKRAQILREWQHRKRHPALDCGVRVKRNTGQGKLYQCTNRDESGEVCDEEPFRNIAKFAQHFLSEHEELLPREADRLRAFLQRSGSKKTPRKPDGCKRVRVDTVDEKEVTWTLDNAEESRITSLEQRWNCPPILSTTYFTPSQVLRLLSPKVEGSVYGQVPDSRTALTFPDIRVLSQLQEATWLISDPEGVFWDRRIELDGNNPLERIGHATSVQLYDLDKKTIKSCRRISSTEHKKTSVKSHQIALLRQRKFWANSALETSVWRLAGPGSRYTVVQAAWKPKLANLSELKNQLGAGRSIKRPGRTRFVRRHPVYEFGVEATHIPGTNGGYKVKCRNLLPAMEGEEPQPCPYRAANIKTYSRHYVAVHGSENPERAAAIQAYEAANYKYGSLPIKAAAICLFHTFGSWHRLEHMYVEGPKRKHLCDRENTRPKRRKRQPKKAKAEPSEQNIEIDFDDTETVSDYASDKEDTSIFSEYLLTDSSKLVGTEHSDMKSSEANNPESDEDMADKEADIKSLYLKAEHKASTVLSEAKDPLLKRPAKVDQETEDMDEPFFSDPRNYLESTRLNDSEDALPSIDNMSMDSMNSEDEGSSSMPKDNLSSVSEWERVESRMSLTPEASEDGLEDESEGDLFAFLESLEGPRPWITWLQSQGLLRTSGPACTVCGQESKVVDSPASPDLLAWACPDHPESWSEIRDESAFAEAPSVPLSSLITLICLTIQGSSLSEAADLTEVSLEDAESWLAFATDVMGEDLVSPAQGQFTRVLAALGQRGVDL